MQRQVLTAAVGLIVMVLLAGCMGTPSETPASLAVSPGGEIDFGETTSTRMLSIRNTGGRSLEWEIEVAYGDEGADGWLTVDKTTGTDRADVLLTVSRDGLEPGSSHTATLTIDSTAGSEQLLVRMRVADAATEPPKSLSQVEGLDARGFTLPAGGDDLIVASDAFGPSARARGLLDMASRFEATMASTGTDDALRPASVGFASMPMGYEAAFVLSWDAVDGAEAYELFVADAEDGRFSVVETVSVGDLDDADEPTYMMFGEYDVGEEMTFRVRAVAAGVDAGRPSDPDTGVIIAPQGLESPADGSGASDKPLFVWEAHPEATGYALFLDEGTLGDRVYEYVTKDPDTTEVRYPQDDPAASPSLSTGAYLWYVLAQGPAMDGKAAGYAVSKVYAFTVGGAD